MLKRKPPPPYVAAIDMGTSRVRALVFDARGTLCSAASADMPIRTIPALGPLAKTLPPRLLWALICRLVRGASEKAGVASSEIAGIAVTSQREGGAIVDERGRELYLAPNTDLRAFIEGQTLDEKHREAVYRTTGHTPSFLLAPAKLHWLRNNQPELYKRARWVLSLDAWAALKLGAMPALAVPAAVELGLAEVRTGETARPLLADLGIPPGLVPPLVMPGAVIGHVSRGAAARTGLGSGTPIIAAGPDTQCALLGMGATGAGDVGIVAGWSAPAQMVLDRPVLDPQMRTWTGRHFMGQWVLESTAADAGRGYAWVRETFFPGAKENALLSAAAIAGPGANGALAYLGPGVANMGSLGAAMGGLLFPLLSSFQPTNPGDLLRATLENIAFAIKGNILQLEAVSGQAAKRIALAGGMSGNPVFQTLLMNVLGRDVLLPRGREITGLGAAICAAVGAGVYSRMPEGEAAMASSMVRVRPDDARTLEYQEHYERWLTVKRALEPLGAAL